MAEGGFVMEDKKTNNKVRQEPVHNLILESRKRLSVSGVDEVESFNEEEIILRTHQSGVLIIKGSQLHINRLNVDTGDVNITGVIDSMDYIAESPDAKGPGFLARLLK